VIQTSLEKDWKTGSPHYKMMKTAFMGGSFLGSCSGISPRRLPGRNGSAPTGFGVSGSQRCRADSHSGRPEQGWGTLSKDGSRAGGSWWLLFPVITLTASRCPTFILAKPARVPHEVFPSSCHCMCGLYSCLF